MRTCIQLFWPEACETSQVDDARIVAAPTQGWTSAATFAARSAPLSRGRLTGLSTLLPLACAGSPVIPACNRLLK